MQPQERTSQTRPNQMCRTGDQTERRYQTGNTWSLRNHGLRICLVVYLNKSRHGGSRVVLTAAIYDDKVGARGTARKKNQELEVEDISTPGSAISRSQSQPAQLRKYKSNIPPATALPPKANEVSIEN
ncbi:unnamed protein product [Brassica oleracea var. botrytis]